MWSLISYWVGKQPKTTPSGRQRHGRRCGVFKLPSPPPCCCYWCSIKLRWERVHAQLLHVAPFSSSIQCGSGGPRTLKALGWCRSARRIGWKKDGAGGSSGSSTVAPSFHAEKKTDHPFQYRPRGHGWTGYSALRSPRCGGLPGSSWCTALSHTSYMKHPPR